MGGARAGQGGDAPGFGRRFTLRLGRLHASPLGCLGRRDPLLLGLNRRIDEPRRCRLDARDRRIARSLRAGHNSKTRPRAFRLIRDAALRVERPASGPGPGPGDGTRAHAPGAGIAAADGAAVIADFDCISPGERPRSASVARHLGFIAARIGDAAAKIGRDRIARFGAQSPAAPRIGLSCRGAGCARQHTCRENHPKSFHRHPPLPEAKR